MSSPRVGGGVYCSGVGLDLSAAAPALTKVVVHFGQRAMVREALNTYVASGISIDCTRNSANRKTGCIQGEESIRATNVDPEEKTKRTTSWRGS